MDDKIASSSPSRYVVITGDLKSSRKLKERAKIQENFKNALKTVNKKFKGTITAEFIITGGDSFQGMFSSLYHIFDIYYELFVNIGYPFYLGVGVGGISTKLSNNVGEMDGEAFHRSAEALEKVKKDKAWIGFRSGWDIDDIVTSSWNLMADVIWNWSKRQKEIITYYRNHGENREAVKSAAKRFGVGERSIYKTLRTGKYHLLKAVENSLKEILNQKWFNSNIEPEKGDRGR